MSKAYNARSERHQNHIVQPLHSTQTKFKLIVLVSRSLGRAIFQFIIQMEEVSYDLVGKIKFYLLL